MEALTEFAVDTNGFKAEFGQAGGGVMTFASKSGTNRFHGSAYDFLRNDAMDARGVFARTRSVYRQNDFGFTASGPVLIPKVYNGRNKTFFFAHVGYIKERKRDLFLQKLPEIAYRSGDFSALGKTIVDGAGGAPFPGNQIPASRFDKNSLGYLKM